MGLSQQAINKSVTLKDSKEIRNSKKGIQIRQNLAREIFML